MPVAVSQLSALERNPEFNGLPPGTRLVARLETPVSTAVRAPVVAAIEYNYEHDGEIVIPAGSRAFGELDQSNDRGFVGIRFHSLQLADQSEAKIAGRSMSLEFQPLKGKVTGTNAGKRFLVRSLTGVGTIAAATVGVQSGLGVTDTISNNVLLRERVANNIALAGDQQLTELAYRNFAQILQTARGTNTAFLFSMQSLAQLMQVGRGFKEQVTSAPNTTMTLRTRDEETAKYFIKASAEQTVVRRSIFTQRGFFGLGKYEETGRATETEDRETRSQDESIKNLPKGRMEILMSEDSRGTLHSLLQVRPPEDVSIPDFVPTSYPPMVQSRAESSGANLRFKDPELERKYRVPSRYAGGYRR